VSPVGAAFFRSEAQRRGQPARAGDQRLGARGQLGFLELVEPWRVRTFRLADGGEDQALPDAAEIIRGLGREPRADVEAQRTHKGVAVRQPRGVGPVRLALSGIDRVAGDKGQQVFPSDRSKPSQRDFAATSNHCWFDGVGKQLKNRRKTTVNIDRTYPLAEAPQAHIALEAGEFFGSVLSLMNDGDTSRFGAIWAHVGAAMARSNFVVVVASV
jgi:hypothetical protein